MDHFDDGFQDGTPPAETNICEECGREYRIDGFNVHAPYSMCTSCYEEYLDS